MTEVAKRAHERALEILAAPNGEFVGALNNALNEILGGAFTCVSGFMRAQDGAQSDVFATVVATPRQSGTEPQSIPADETAAVVDVNDVLDLGGLRAAYGRIARAKRLLKTSVPHGETRTNITLGVILSRTASVPLDAIAEELGRLNAETPNYQWPDMVVVLASGVINYGVQFPGGGKIGGDFLPPAAGAGRTFVPAIYVLTVLKPTGDRSLNKMLGFLIGHLFFFSPGKKLPSNTEITEGTTNSAVTFTGYQFNSRGELVPVPREMYNDRLLPELPLRIETREGEVLSTIQFIPWQDGGAILMRGKLPLVGLMPFFGRKDVLQRFHSIPDGDRQISSVLPITRKDFVNFLKRFQQRSNMVVRNDPGRFVIQKVADEGTRSPFMARLFLAPLKLRESAVDDNKARDRFDSLHESIMSDLISARSSAETIRRTWVDHIGKLKTGEILQSRGRHINVTESIDKVMRSEVDTFLNTASRALKTGMQALGNEFGIQIGFLFQKPGSFNKGIVELRATQPELADYLQNSRAWSEPLMMARNAIEHEGWKLPRISYLPDGDKLVAQEPLVLDQPVTKFVTETFDRLCCFIEEFVTYCLKQKLPGSISVTEIAKADRPADVPMRFMITVSKGGMPQWQIAYDQKPFDDK